MISKELFCQTLADIKEQEQINEDFGKAIEKMGDGHFLWGVENKFHSALMNVLAAVFQDDGDYISWWLYENVEKKVWLADGTEVSLETDGQLYDFLLENLSAKSAQ